MAPASLSALHLSPLDGVRGLAATMVVLGHLLTFFSPRADRRTWLLASPPPPPTGAPAAAPLPPFTPFVDDAPWPLVGVEFLSAVTMFFVISGFALVATYSGADSPLGAAFVRRRVARLLPMYCAGLALGLVPFLVYTHDPATLTVSVIASLSVTTAIISPGQLSGAWDGPLWTVSAFAVCYALFPWLLRRLQPLSCAQLRAACLGLAALSATIGIAWIGATGLAATPPLHFFALFRLPQFALGVARALLAQRRPLRRPVLRAELCSAALGLNLLACALAVASVAGRQTGPAASLLWWKWCYLAEFALPVLHAEWLAALSSPAGARGLSARLLSSGPLRLLGAWSYSLYCIHFPLIQWLAWTAAGRISYAAVPFAKPSYLPAWCVLRFGGLPPPRQAQCGASRRLRRSLWSHDPAGSASRQRRCCRCWLAASRRRQLATC